MGQYRRSQDLAELLLTNSANLSAMQQPDYFQHSSRTLLGLVRLQAGATAEAVVQLNESLRIKPGMMLLAGRPAVRLADALWKNGERKAVVRYLELAAALEWTSAKSMVEKWLREALAGDAPSFFGASGPVGK